MRPAEKVGTSILENDHEVDVAIQAVERRARELGGKEAVSLRLISELLDDYETPAEIGIEPTRLILSAFECVRSDPDAGGLLRQQATEVYGDYRTKAMQSGKW